jgi:hypothetical protein
MTTSEIIVTIGVAIIGTISAYVQLKLKKFNTTYAPMLEKFNEQFKEQIGQQQYQKDVDVIKNVITQLDINKTDITIEVATEIVKQVAKKVNFNETEILDIITKIIKGVL